MKRFQVGLESGTLKRNKWIGRAIDLSPYLFVCVAVLVFFRRLIADAFTNGWADSYASIGGDWTYNRTVIAVNYLNDGFIRRGLGGTIAALLSSDWKDSGFLFTAISLLILVTALATLSAMVNRSAGFLVFAYVSAVVVLSPQTFLGWSTDFVRTDMLVGGLLAWSVVAMLRGYRAAGVTLVLVGYLVHETAVIFGIPLMLCILYDQFEQGSISKKSFGVLMLSSIAGIAMISALQYVFSNPPSSLAQNMLESSPSGMTGEQILHRDIALYMAVAGSDALQTALCYNISFNSQYIVMAIICLLFLVLYSVVFHLWPRPLMTIIVVFVPVIFMILIANDTGRWLKLGVLNGWLLMAASLVAGAKTARFTFWSMALGASLLVLFLSMGSTKHNVVNPYTRMLVERAGYQRPGTLAQWMDTCDPDWRRVVYGHGRL